MSEEFDLHITILDMIAGRMKHLQDKRSSTPRAGEQFLLDAHLRELRWLFDEVSSLNVKKCDTPTSETD